MLPIGNGLADAAAKLGLSLHPSNYDAEVAIANLKDGIQAIAKFLARCTQRRIKNGNWTQPGGKGQPANSAACGELQLTKDPNEPVDTVVGHYPAT